MKDDYKNIFPAKHILLAGRCSEKNKGGLHNPSKRFCRFLKASKCVQSSKKRIKNLTEPFEGSAFYPLAEPSLTKPFLGSVQQKKVSWKTTKP